MSYDLQKLREVADKCQDPETFLAHCGIAQPPGIPTRPFHVNSNQRKLIKAQESRNFLAIQAAPEVGLTLLYAGLALHQATYNTDQRIMIACGTWQESRDTILAIERLIEDSPGLVELGLIPKVDGNSRTKNRIRFENGSVITGDKLNAYCTRGTRLDTMFVSDVSLCEDSDVQEHFEQMVLPCFASGENRKLYVANGDGQYHTCFNRLWESPHFENVVLNHCGA